MAIKILLTGATGFLGSHLLESFISQGFDVAVINRSTSDLWRISHLMGKFKIYNIDNINFKTIFTRRDCVYCDLFICHYL